MYKVQYITVFLFACSPKLGETESQTEDTLPGAEGSSPSFSSADSPTTGSSTTSSSTTSSSTSFLSSTVATESSSEMTTSSMNECDDNNDAHGSEVSADELFAINCMGGAFELDGFINSAEDVDWYVYTADQGPDLCSEPALEHTVEATEDLLVCAYLVCSGPKNTYITCLDGSIGDISLEEREGCCGKNGVLVSMACSEEMFPEGRVYLKIEPASAESIGRCIPYTLTYSYENL